jgi:hypothetical protein
MNGHRAGSPVEGTPPLAAGAHRAATLLGFAATARNVGVDFEKYFCWALERRGTWRDRYGLPVTELTPVAYKPAIEAGTAS